MRIQNNPLNCPRQQVSSVKEIWVARSAELTLNGRTRQSLTLQGEKKFWVILVNVIFSALSKIVATKKPHALGSFPPRSQIDDQYFLSL